MTARLDCPACGECGERCADDQARCAVATCRVTTYQVTTPPDVYFVGREGGR